MRAVNGFARTTAAVVAPVSSGTTTPSPLLLLLLLDRDDILALALATAAAASARARSSLICGTLVTKIRSTRASATRRTPQRAKGDCGREKVGEMSFFSLRIVRALYSMYVHTK